jgi:hypothetical protein
MKLLGRKQRAASGGMTKRTECSSEERKSGGEFALGRYTIVLCENSAEHYCPFSLSIRPTRARDSGAAPSSAEKTEQD